MLRRFMTTNDRQSVRLQSLSERPPNSRSASAFNSGPKGTTSIRGPRRIRSYPNAALARVDESDSQQTAFVVIRNASDCAR